MAAVNRTTQVENQQQLWDRQKATNYVEKGDLDALTKILKDVARGEDEQKGKIDVNLANFWGETLLHEAASIGKEEVVEFLLNWGADPSIEDTWGRRPIDAARIFKQNQAEDILLGGDASFYVKG
uniref:Myotrophin n=1 Tax=Paramoeba aestuarina TaxID=180227 RepID=A0A7S4NZ11_9EUKA|mmetsp:Transcript_31926/g.49996  ORF Transcript_31926/g.49996 Transcript_31926/m.49996 type:complete len:125 (+) Transcript_31926:261-635(+)